MTKWEIYHKDGSVLTDVNKEQIIVHGLEYSDSWMAECFVNVNFKHNAPINFSIGDYFLYRGERFELNYDPGKVKCARKNTYGEGFVYDNVKLNSLQDELARAEFLDVVLYDNQLHYTSLPKFSFYVSSIDDLLDRIQANMSEQISDGKWKFFSRNMERSMQRGCSKEEWESVYGSGTADSVIDSKQITIDSKTCWEALVLVHEEFGVNFIVRNRNVYVGTAGKSTQNIFEYGLGKGLYQVDQNADSDQRIITRLRAYGSERNLPDHYYADLGVKYKANVMDIKEASSFVELDLDLPYIETYFKNPRKFNVGDGSGEQANGFVLKVTFDFVTEITGYVTDDGRGNCRFYSELKGTQDDNGDEESKEALDAFIAQVNSRKNPLYIVSGVNKKTFPNDFKIYADNLPNNMAISRLMLPGFPHVSLKDFYDSLSDSEKAYVNPGGREHNFSTDPHRPYIDSLNLERIGLRSSSQFFDTDDKTNGIIEIYPTIEEMEINGVRIDEIYKGSNINDNGRFEDGQTVNNFDIYLNPAVDFDINELKDSDFTVCMKDGMCGGREFKVASSTMENGAWRLTLERVKDDALGLYFPYNDFQIKAGDHFVLTGIELPDSYVRAASLKLLKYAIALLDKNDYTRYVYQPKVDEIFMARQHDAAMNDETGATISLHDTLKAGDLMRFYDEDFGIDAEITIDQLTIKEEDGKIPTYEITLRDDKEVGTIQKIQQQISSLTSGNGGGVNGATMSQIKGQVPSEGSKYFLSKLNDDTAQGFIEFLKGLKSDELVQLLKGATFGNNGYAFDKNGNIVINSAQSLDFDDALQKGFGLTRNNLGKYELSLTNLFVWGKAVFNELEIRKLSSVGGNVVLSAAASKIVHVEEYSSTDTGVIGWKCYLLTDDGTTATTNGWKKFDQARCQQFNVKEGTYHNVSNRDYWRAVVDVSTKAETIYGSREVVGEDGTVTIEKYDLYDGKKFDWIVLSATNCRKGENDDPMAGDTIVLDGHQQFADDSNNAIYNDTDRTNLIMLETTGTMGVPRIVALANVADFEHDEEKNMVFVLSPTKVIFVTKFFEFRSAGGDSVTLINNKGAWQEGTKYYYYDQVVYENAYWTCIAKGDKEPTTEKPSLDSSVWRKDLEIGEAVKVENTEILYAIGDEAENPTQPTDDKFVYNDINKALADIEIGDYLWSKTIVTYTDGHETVTYGVSRLGEDGASGKPGVNGMTTHFAYAEGIVFGSDGKATGVTGQFSTTLFNGAQYIGTYTDNVTTDSTDFKKYNWTKLKGERGDKGDKGSDSVVYSVVMSYASQYISSVLTYGMRVLFRKTTGNNWENLTLTSDKKNGYSQVYIDGSYNNDITTYLNNGNGFVDYSAYPDAIKSNSKIRVDWYDKEGALLAIGNYNVAGGSVIAYCNSDNKPSKPTATDINNLSGGWSLTPKSGGTTTKFSNVSFGNYSVGATKTGYTTSEWSEVTDGGYVWRKSPAGLSDNYGWALMKVSFTTNIDNVDIEVALKAYSETNYDTMQVYALDAEVSLNVGTDYHNSGIAHTSGNGVSSSYTYNVARAGQHFFYVAYAKDMSGNSNGDYGLFRIASQASVSLSSVVWMSKADVKDGRVQLPWSDPVKVTGEDGEKGEDALEIIVTPDTLIYDSDDNGLVSNPVAQAKTASVSCYRNGVKATDIIYRKSSVLNCDADVITSSAGTATVKINEIIQQTVSVDGNTAKVSQASGSVFLTAYDPRTKLYHQVQVKFQVNIAKYTGVFTLTNKQLSSKFNELTNDGDITKLTDYKSEILQTAREISLSVSEKAMGRRNMLPGSALRKQNDGPEFQLKGDFIDGTTNNSSYQTGYYGGQGILMNDGVNGSNCFKCKCYYLDSWGESYQYPGLFWRGGYGSKNIKIEKGKTYVVSVWAKCSSKDLNINIECVYKPSENADNSLRNGQIMLRRNKARVDNINTWELFTAVMVLDDSKIDAGYNYTEVNFHISHRTPGQMVTVYFCRPMMEEGDTYNGWTLSEEDYDYIGGNLLDNAATLNVSGNLKYSEAEPMTNGFEDGVNARHIKVSSGYKALAQWGYMNDPVGLQPNTDYIFSFWAKGTSLVAYAYRGNNDAELVKEDCLGAIKSSTSYDDGNTAITLTSQWKRYWIHWRTKSRTEKIPQMILLRTYTEAWIAKPKLEIGCTMTDWTEKRTDMVDKQALLATGIDITNKKIVLTADKTQFRDNNGVEMAVFENGKFKASFIDADEVVASGIKTQELEAQNLNVTGNSKLGIWRISSDKNWGSVMKAYGVMYGETEVISGIDYCPMFIRGGSPDATEYFRVGPNCTEFSYPHGNSFNGIWLGQAAKFVCNGNAGAMHVPFGYLYNGSYTPAAYIYSVQETQDSPALAINVLPNGYSGTATAIQTNGAIRGVMAPNILVTSVSQQIGSTVSVVICRASNVTLTLPANPVVGQTLIIFNQYENVTIKKNSVDGKQLYGDAAQNSVISGGKGTITYLIFDGSYWSYAYFNGHHK